MRLMIYADTKENDKLKAVSFTDFSSLLIVIIVETQGKYNNENATNEIDAASEKLAASPPEDAGYNTESVDTIISFEPTPTSKDEAARHVPKPSGINSGAITFEINARILFFISFIGDRLME